MFKALTGLGYSIIAFSILVVIGMVVVGQLGASVAQCPATFPVYNGTTQLCQNATYQTVGPSVATTTSNTVITYLGSSGLAGWIPAIIALMVGVIFLVSFGFGNDPKRK